MDPFGRQKVDQKAHSSEKGRARVPLVPPPPAYAPVSLIWSNVIIFTVRRTTLASAAWALSVQVCKNYVLLYSTSYAMLL